MGATLGSIRYKLIKELSQKNKESAQQDADILLGSLLKKTHAQLLCQPNELMTSDAIEQLKQWLNRYCFGEPLAYILGFVDFMGLSLIVNKNVLIPRNDTEVLVVHVLNDIDKHKVPLKQQQSIRILELGTGSGAIAVAIAHYLKAKEISHIIHASDISQNALDIAKANAIKHNLDIIFIKSDWFASIESGSNFDYIISNPPYIAKDDGHLPQLIHEPLMALVAKENGLQAIKDISKQAKNYSHSQTQLIIEHGYQQAEAVQEIFLDNRMANIESYLDNSGQYRFTKAKFNT